MTDAEQEWRRLGYGAQIDELKKTLNDPTLCGLYETRMLKPDDLKTFSDCVHFANQESQYNWFNYWPYNSGSGGDAESRKARINARIPEQCKSDILSGKLYELLAALKYKGDLTEYPTIFQPKPRAEYDFKVKWGREYKCDCKSSFNQAFAHVSKYKDNAAVYPVSEGVYCDFRRVFYDDETRLRLYLDGKLDLSVDDLRQIRLSLDEDIGCRPESKYWAAHGYASREEWYEANGESLEEYDRSIDARQKLLAEAEKKIGAAIEPADYPADEDRLEAVYENGEPPALFGKTDVRAALASVAEFFEESGVNIRPYPKVVFDCERQDSFLHFCIGVYDPEKRAARIPIGDRSPNDAFRALFHELVHHSQTLSGEFERKTEGLTPETSDVGLHPGLTELEEDANARGFRMFRVWARREKAKSENPFWLG